MTQLEYSPRVQAFVERLEDYVENGVSPEVDPKLRGQLKSSAVPTSDTALLIIDMQNTFVKDECALAREGLDISMMQAAVPKCAKLIAAARAVGVLVVYTRYVYLPGYADAAFGQSKQMQQERGLGLGYQAWDAEIADELAPLSNETIIDKSRPSSFYGTRLEPLLTGQQIRSLVVCGVTTNICVETTVRDAHQRGYETFVVADATAEFELSRQHHALFTMNWSFGNVVSTEEVCSSWALDRAEVEVPV